MRRKLFVAIAVALAPIIILTGLRFFGFFSREEPPGNLRQMLVARDPGSSWTLERDGSNVTARLPRERLTVELSGAPTSASFAGVSVIWRGRDYSTGYFGRKSPLLLPEHPRRNQEVIEVRARKSDLFVRMEEGRISDLRKEGSRLSAPGPLIFQARIRPAGDGVEIRLDGFYYVILPMEGSVLRVKGETIRPERLPGGLAYLEGPLAMEARVGGRAFAHLRTNARKLQIEARDRRGREGLPQAFELDFDHAFKDLGQRHITSVLRLLSRD